MFCVLHSDSDVNDTDEPYCIDAICGTGKDIWINENQFKIFVVKLRFATREIGKDVSYDVRFQH